MSNKYSTLKKNTIIFTIGNIGSSLISFILIPLFTNYLTTSEYGRIDFITMLISLLIPIITLNFIEALIRFGVDKEYESKEVISTIIFSIIPIYGVLLIIFLILIKLDIINNSILGYLGIFFVVSLYQFLQQYTRVIEKLIIYATSDILYTIIFSVLNVIFIAKFRAGIQGYFTSYIIAYITASIFLIIKAKIYKDIKLSLYNKEYLREFIKYSTPLIPNNLSWWIVNASDRFLIKIFCGYSNLGIYSIANKIPQILNTFYGLFFKAWQISSIKELGKEDTERFYEQIFKYISKAMFTVGICILLGINVIFFIMIGEEFKDAINYVSVLVLAIIFFTLSLYNKEYLREFIKYSTPLIPNNLSWWIVNASDRFLIKIFCGYSNLGIYSIANKIPQILNTFYGLFFKAWQISSIKELGKEDTERFYEQIFKYISKAMFTVGICILLGINVIFFIMIGEEFKDAINYVSVLVLAIIFFTLASFLGSIYTAYKKSKNVLKSTIISAVINIALNILFMPFWGAIVSCYSTLASYLFLFIYRLYDSRQFMKLKIDVKDLIISSLIFILMTINIGIFKLSLTTFIINVILFIMYIVINRKYCALIIEYLMNKVKKRRVA